MDWIKSIPVSERLTPEEYKKIKLAYPHAPLTGIRSENQLLYFNGIISNANMSFPILLYLKQIISFDELIQYFKMFNSSKEDRVVAASILVSYANNHRYLCPNASAPL